jgi:hypothetical protein
MDHVQGPDNRKWRTVTGARPCRTCGNQPIAARSGRVGWHLQCPTDWHHGLHFEQWLPKCIRKWDIVQSPAKA